MATVLTLLAAIQEFIRIYTTEGMSKQTIEGYRRRLHQFVEWADQKGITLLTQLDVEVGRAYILQLQERTQMYKGRKDPKQKKKLLAPITVAGHVRVIKSWGTFCESERYVTESPFARLKIPKATYILPHPLTLLEMREILGSIERETPTGYRLYALMVLMYDMGLRVSEAVGLRLADINMVEGTAYIMGKGAAQRQIPISDDAVRVLRHYVDTYRPQPDDPTCDYVFLTVAGQPWARDAVEKSFDRLEKRTQIGRLHPHRIRHAFAHDYIMNGGDTASLKDILGHSNLQTTQGYVKLVSSDLKAKHQQHSPFAVLQQSHRGPGRPRKYPRGAKPERPAPSPASAPKPDPKSDDSVDDTDDDAPVPVRR